MVRWVAVTKTIKFKQRICHLALTKCAFAWMQVESSTITQTMTYLHIKLRNILLEKIKWGWEYHNPKKRSMNSWLTLTCTGRIKMIKIKLNLTHCTLLYQKRLITPNVFINLATSKNSTTSPKNKSQSTNRKWSILNQHQFLRENVKLNKPRYG